MRSSSAMMPASNHAPHVLHLESPARQSFGSSGPCDVHAVIIPQSSARLGAGRALGVLDATSRGGLGARAGYASLRLLRLRPADVRAGDAPCARSATAAAMACSSNTSDQSKPSRIHGGPAAPATSTTSSTRRAAVNPVTLPPDRRRDACRAGRKPHRNGQEGLRLRAVQGHGREVLVYVVECDKQDKAMLAASASESAASTNASSTMSPTRPHSLPG